ncbi:MAG: TIM barrel protein [Christensenellales bacterium]
MRRIIPTSQTPIRNDRQVDFVRVSVACGGKTRRQTRGFHPASQGKAEREEAVALARDNIAKMMTVLGETLPFSDYILCPETMGKIRQIGTVEEIVSFCKLDPHLYPCYDFGHINCYMHGGLKTEDDYRRIIDYTFAELGEEKAKNIHIHFSKIQYGESGEIRHLTFADTIYGPEYAPLAKIIDEYRMTPFIVCESDGTMAEDALNMKKHHKNV